MPKISVVITTYCRFKDLNKIILAWLGEPVIEVWLIDGSGKFRTGVSDKRFLLFSMPKDLGTKMDYAIGLLTAGDMIILADDDVLPRPGLVGDLCKGIEDTGASIVGIHGRSFHGPNYRKNTKCFTAAKIIKPAQVAFCGVVIMLPRELLGFDVRGMEIPWDDLWLCMKACPDKTKYVIPTKNWRRLPVASDASSLFHNKDMQEIRGRFYTEWYNRNYKPEGRIY